MPHCQHALSSVQLRAGSADGSLNIAVRSQSATTAQHSTARTQQSRAEQSSRARDKRIPQQNARVASTAALGAAQRHSAASVQSSTRTHHHTTPPALPALEQYTHRWSFILQISKPLLPLFSSLLSLSLSLFTPLHSLFLSPLPSLFQDGFFPDPCCPCGGCCCRRCVDERFWCVRRPLQAHGPPFLHDWPDRRQSAAVNQSTNQPTNRRPAGRRTGGMMAMRGY